MKMMMTFKLNVTVNCVKITGIVAEKMMGGVIAVGMVILVRFRNDLGRNCLAVGIYFNWYFWMVGTVAGIKELLLFKMGIKLIIMGCLFISTATAITMTAN